jgi:hypothetical protein
MRIPGISHVRLMEESEARIAHVAREGAPPQAALARRLLEDTRLYRRWEVEHSQMLRPVAKQTRGQHQSVALRRTCFGLIHRKAMFEYLRGAKITGRDRHAVFALVYGEQHDYASAVIQEHANYMRASASLMCATWLGLSLIVDGVFADPLARYEALYADYFRSFCGTALATDQYKSGDTLRTLVPYLKGQLSDLRRAILALPQEPDTGLHHIIDLSTKAANTSGVYQAIKAAS